MKLASCFLCCIVVLLIYVANILLPKHPEFYLAEKTTNSRCNELLEITDKQQFQAVNRADTYVFSAYLDDSYPGGYRQIKIIGLTLADSHNVPRMLCFIRVAEKQDCIITPAIIYRHPNAFGQRFVPASLVCPLNFSGHPIGVSVITTEEMVLTNKMTVMNRASINYRPLAPLKNFVICVAPLQNIYNNTDQLVQSVEFNRLLGAERFIFYNSSITAEIDIVLRTLIAEGLAEVVQWRLPTAEIHYYGQIAAADDCILRCARGVRFVINTDLDEVIVPQNSADWTGLRRHVLDTDSNVGAFIVRTVHFYTFAANHTNTVSKMDFVRKHNMLPLLSTNRSSYIWPVKKRSKLIVRPNCVTHMGIHKVWGLKGTFKSKEIQPEQALVYHYRETPQHKAMTPSSYITDLSVYRFKDDLIRRINDRWGKLKNDVQ